jgi:psiF repeat
MTMVIRFVATLALAAMLAPATPASAVTAAEKMETCKFGADHQKLAGAARKKFLARCMAEDRSAKTPKSQ